MSNPVRSMSVLLVVALFASANARAQLIPASDPCHAAGSAPAALFVGGALPTADLAVPVQDELLPGDGQFTQAFPLELPAGRNGMAPELVARYFTSAENGPLGAGWVFELGSIALSRRPNVGFDRPKFELLLPTGAAKLVPCRGAVGEFRVEIEEHFFRIRQMTDAAGVTWWHMTKRDGTQFHFGPTAASRLANPSNAAQVARWGLARIVDVHGNFVEVDYAQPATEMLLPEEIRYAGHMDGAGQVDVQPPVRVRFTWEPRTDPITSHRFGFRQRLSKRLAAIRVIAAAQTQRSYEFAYTVSTSTGRSLLTRLTTVGSDGLQNPPVTFRYTVPTYSLADQAPIAAPVGPGWLTTSLADTLASKASLRYGDVDGDGRVDACVLEANGYQCYLAENVTGTVPAPLPIVEEDLPPPPPPTGPGPGVIRITEPRFAATTRLLPELSGAPWREQTRIAGIRLTDVNADGRTDVCARDPEGVLCALSPGRGVVAWTIVRGPSWRDADGFNAFSTGGTLAFPDLDGDGLSDTCIRATRGIVCALGTGSGFGTTFDGPAWSDAAGWNAQDRFGTIQYPDLDGDGGADICARSDQGIVCAIHEGNAFRNVHTTSLLWSNAAGWSDVASYTTIAFPDLNADGVADACGRQPNGQMICAIGTGTDFIDPVTAPMLSNADGWNRQSQFASLQFVDLNADQQSDLCGRTRTGWQCWINNGRELIAAPLIAQFTDPEWSADDRGSTLRSVDMGGLGIPAVCGRDSSRPACRKASGTAWELLSEWSNGFGSSSEMSYGTSADLENLRLPIVVPVLRRLRANGAITSFDYAGGYFDAKEGDFRGFAFVRISGPDDLALFSGPHPIREVWLHQGDRIDVLPWHHQTAEQTWLFEMSLPDQPLAGTHDATDPVGALRGKPYRIVERDSAQTFYEERLLTYRADADGAPFYHPLVREDVFTCEGVHCRFPLPPVRTPTNTGNPANFNAQLLEAVRAGRLRQQFEAASFRRSTSWVYDDLGNVLEQHEAGDPDLASDDRITRFTYSNDATTWLLGLVESEEILEGPPAGARLLRRTTYAYDESPACTGSPVLTGRRGLRTSVTRVDAAAGSARSRIDYDRFGNRICERDAEGRVTRIAYDAETATHAVAETNALNHRRSFAIHGIGANGDGGAYGQRATIVDENGAITRLSYDGLGRLRRILRPQGGAEEIAYLDLGDPARQRVRRTKPQGNWEETHFDGLGRTVTHTASAAEGKEIVETAAYSSRGMIARSHPRFSGEPEAAIRIELDVRGNPLRVVHPDGRVESWCRGGRTTVVTDAAARIHLEERDVHGRRVVMAALLASAAPPSPQPDPLTGSLQQLLAAPLERPCSLDRLTAVSSLRTEFRGDDLPRAFVDTNGNRTEILYDGLARRTGARLPNGRTEAITYDRTDRRLTTTDARGAVTRYEYDAIGRLQRERSTLGGSTRTVQYAHDSGAFGIGRISRVSVPEGAIAFRYDQLGRVTDESYEVGGNTFTYSIVFDDEGRPTRQQFPDGFVIRMIYDGPQLTEVWDPTTRLLRYTSFTPAREAQRVEYANGVVVERSYSGRPGARCPEQNLRLCDETIRNAAGVLASRSYTYDPSGLIRRIVEPQVAFDYDYDERAQLVSARRTVAPAAPDVELYRHDAIGNLREKGSIAFTHPGGAFLPEAAATIGGTAATYDADGRMLSAATGAFTYDTAGRLLTAQRNGQTLRLAYDGEGRLLTSSIGAVRRTRLGDEAECSATDCTSYIIVGGERVISRGADGRFEYAVHDHLGSLRLVTDGEGNVVRRFEYDAFGFPDGGGALPGEALDRRLYAGREWFPGFELSHYSARFYLPALGRFLTPDPARTYDPTLQTYNAYAYASNDPVSSFDPTGLWTARAAKALDTLVRTYESIPAPVRNIGEGAFAAVLGGAGVALGVQTGNPGMILSSAHVFSAGIVQLSIGVIQALSPDTMSQQMQTDWEAVEDYLDPNKIVAGAIAAELGLSREIGYLGVNLGGMGSAAGTIGRSGKGSLLGIGNLLLEGKSFLETLNEKINKDSQKGGSDDGSDDGPAKDPFDGWKPESIFRGGTPPEGDPVA